MITVRPAAAALTTTALLVTTGCGALPGAGPGGQEGPDGLQTLAKVDGGQQVVADPAGSFASLLLAYDETTAHRLWDENVPAGLPRRDGDPVEEGQYGDLSDVDLDGKVVALWSSGQSGSCPGWLSGVSTDDGAVVVTEGIDTGGADVCSDDYNAYRTVVVLDRDAVPVPEALRPEGTIDDHGMTLSVLVAAYPAA